MMYTGLFSSYLRPTACIFKYTIRSWYKNKHHIYFSYKSSDMTPLPTKHPSLPSSELWGHSGLLQGRSVWSKCHMTSVWRALSQRSSFRGVRCAAWLFWLREDWENTRNPEGENHTDCSPTDRRIDLCCCWRAAPTIPCRCQLPVILPMCIRMKRKEKWKQENNKNSLLDIRCYIDQVCV